MSESIKESELRIWRTTLGDEDRRFNEPEHLRGELYGHAKTLARLDIIDLFELRELIAVADTACNHQAG